MRTEARDLHVVPKQIWVLGNLVHNTGKELLLVVEAWSPSQVCSDLQVFP